MIYHVIIALNSEGKRKVGRVVSVIESKGLDLVKIRRKETSSGGSPYQEAPRRYLSELPADLQTAFRLKKKPEKLDQKNCYISTSDWKHCL